MLAALALLFQVSVVAPAVPVMPEPLRVVAFGDNQNGPQTFGRLVLAARAERPDLLAFLGDQIQNRGAVPTEWLDQFLAPLSPLTQVPRIGCIGNHDDPPGFAALVSPLQSHLPGGLGLWGSVDLPGVRWIMLDSNQESAELRLSMAAGGPQRAWLQADLTRPRGGLRLVATWHAPAATSLWDAGCYYPRTDIAHAPWVWAMDALAAAGCDLVLNGHAHGYQRGSWRGMTWVVSGGGGGALDGPCSPFQPELPLAIQAHHYLVLTFDRGIDVRAVGLAGEVDRFLIP